MNEASASYTSVTGGSSNEATAEYATVAGGVSNVAGNFYAVVSGGRFNEALANFSSVTGGSYNVARGIDSSVTGGYSNSAEGFRASVGGGSGNSAGGEYSTVSGGNGNSAAVTYQSDAAPDYDSGWVAISQNEIITLNHNLGGSVDDYTVVLEGKNVDGVHNHHSGGELYYSPPSDTYYLGAWFEELDDTSVKVQRDFNDFTYQSVRIKIWVNRT
jgi:hypothetical protein